MKKIIISLIFTFLFVFALNAFSTDDSLRFNLPGFVIKIGDKIGMSLKKDFYEIKKIQEFNLESSGWYKTSFCGVEIYPVFGSNFFFFDSDDEQKNYGPFLKCDDFDSYIKANFYWGHETKQSDDDYFWTIKRTIKSIEVPDVLEETIHGKKIRYDTYDMEHFYIMESETGCNYFRYYYAYMMSIT